MFNLNTPWPYDHNISIFYMFAVMLSGELLGDRCREMTIFHTATGDLLVLLRSSYLFTLCYETHKFLKLILCKVFINILITQVCNDELNGRFFCKYHDCNYTMHYENNRHELSIGQIGIKLFYRGGKCGGFLCLRQTKTSPGVRFGYDSLNVSWQGFQVVDGTFTSVTENVISGGQNV